MSTIKKYSFFLFLILGVFACKEDDGPDMPEDNFDRGAMLASWADRIIVPGYEQLANRTEMLNTTVDLFLEEQNSDRLEAVRSAWWNAYLAWQEVSMFEIGKAEELGLRDNLNIYPTDTEGIIENIGTGAYNLELPSERDQQGFPAIGFMLYGVGETDAEVLDTYTGMEGIAYLDYLNALTTRLDELTNVVLASWTSGYRDEFVNNDGSSATASVDKMVNDFLFYYEKNLRAGKVGIPAGVFSGSPLPGHVEALYYGKGRLLLERALQSSQDFFNTGNGLADYLQSLDARKDDSPLHTLINDQFDSAKTTIASLDEDLSAQVENDNNKMLEAYDELQKNVVLMKVDMLQALSINVDYVDADGD